MIQSISRSARFASRFLATLFILLEVLSIGVGLVSCSTPSPDSKTPSFQKQKTRPVKSKDLSPQQPPLKGVTQEFRDFKDIREYYANGNCLDVAQGAAAFEAKYPRSAHIPEIENFYGLCELAAKRNVEAISHFKRALQKSPKGTTFNQYILYNLGKAQLEINQIDEAEQNLAEIRPDSLDRENRVKFHYVRSSLYMKRSLPYESARELLVGARLLTESQLREVRSGFQTALDQAVQEIGGTAALEDLYREFEDSQLADVLLFRLGTRERARGSLGVSEIHLQTLISKFPESSYYSQAALLMKDNSIPNVVDHSSIGVLLPLKGKFSKFGAKSLQGIELALKIFNYQEPDSKISLVVEDAGEEPEQAIKALNRLVFKHHVIAVIGPLLSKGIDQVTRRAQELGVPLISLARYTGASGEYVFQAGMTLQLQAYEIARHAIQKLGVRKFAILFPRDRVGEETSQYFWDAVESLGAEIVGVESYTPGETDFRQLVDKLSGLYYTEARERELEELAKNREANKIKRKTRKTEQYYNLKPVVDYEAVFIPDEAKVAGQLLPTFAYRDVEKIKFLGTSAWNSAEFISRAQSGAEGALFVDAFIADTDASVAKKFVEDYHATFAQEPTAMEALAFDAAKVLERALSDSGVNATRATVVESLKAIKGLSGVTGKISYKEGTFFRDLKILTVRAGQIREASR